MHPRESEIYNATDRKVLAFIKLVRLTFKTASGESLVKLSKENKVPNEYGTFLINDGFLITLRGGKCGPAIRKWKGSTPTLKYANELVMRFNKVRHEDRTNAFTEPITIESKLKKVESLLRSIKKEMNKKAS